MCGIHKIKEEQKIVSRVKVENKMFDISKLDFPILKEIELSHATT
jgi:hypothetical protein